MHYFPMKTWIVQLWYRLQLYVEIAELGSGILVTNYYYQFLTLASHEKIWFANGFFTYCGKMLLYTYIFSYKLLILDSSLVHLQVYQFADPKFPFLSIGLPETVAVIVFVVAKIVVLLILFGCTQPYPHSLQIFSLSI